MSDVAEFKDLNSGSLPVARESAVAMCADLATVLACSAHEIIETREDAFDFVEGSTGHLGTQTRVVDYENQRLAEAWEKARFGGDAGVTLFMHSEEANRPFSSKGESHPILLQFDEFDGTTIATGVAGNWAISVLAHIWSARRGDYVLAGSAIALFDGHLVRMVNASRHRGEHETLTAGTVTLARFDLFSSRAPLSTAPVALSPAWYVEDLPPGDPRMVAISAAAGARGTELALHWQGVLTNTTMRTVFAGTPLIYGAIRGRVSVIIDPGCATLHDANHLLILACLGWEVLDADTMLPIDVVAVAERNCRPGSERKPFPPTIAVRDRAARDLVRQLGGQALAG